MIDFVKVAYTQGFKADPYNRVWMADLHRIWFQVHLITYGPHWVSG